MPMTPTIIGLAIAPKIMAPMQKCDHADISIEAGIAGDARGRKNHRQITILFEQDWLDAVAETGEAMDWTERRANIYIADMRSPQQEGGIFTIGDVQLEVMMETDPCDLMEKQRTGLKAALTPDWRGGVCCKVISGGHIKLGDKVQYSE